MFFGEIVEPTTRAILYEEDDPENDAPIFELKWKVDQPIPDRIRTFLAVDTPFTIDLIKRTLLKNKQPSWEASNCDVKLYQLDNDSILCTCRSEEISSATETLMPFIDIAEVVYTLSSASAVNYLNNEISEESMYFLRTLQVNMNDTDIVPLPKLSIPNIVPGLGASLFTYCKFTDKPCQLMVGYVDMTPLDSVNSYPFVKALKLLDLGRVDDCKLTSCDSGSNLYM